MQLTLYLWIKDICYEPYLLTGCCKPYTTLIQNMQGKAKKSFNRLSNE